MLDELRCLSNSFSKRIDRDVDKRLALGRLLRQSAQRRRVIHAVVDVLLHTHAHKPAVPIDLPGRESCSEKRAERIEPDGDAITYRIPPEMTRKIYCDSGRPPAHSRRQNAQVLIFR